MTTNLVSDSKGLVEIGFGASFATIQKMATIAGKPGARFDDIAEVCEELVGRLKDEALAQKFFSLTLKESDFYLNATRGWEKAIERFPSIIDDVEEASKCYALSRYPAAVFHSVQIIEHGLLDLGKFLKVTDPHSGWTAVTNALKKVVDKKYQDRTKFEKQNYEFLEQLHGLVQGLKNAWRNKISHAHGRMIVISKEFSPEIAEEILIATRALMRRLADGLPPPKTGRVPKAGGAS